MKCLRFIIFSLLLNIVVLGTVNEVFCQELTKKDEKIFKKLQSLLRNYKEHTIEIRSQNAEKIEKYLVSIPIEKQLVMANLDCEENNQLTLLTMTIVGNLHRRNQGKMPYNLIMDNVGNKNNHLAFRDTLLDYIGGLRNLGLKFEDITDEEKNHLITTFKRIANDKNDISSTRRLVVGELTNFINVYKNKKIISGIEVKKVGDLFIELLEDNNKDIQLKAIIAIQEIRDERAIEVLWEMFDSQPNSPNWEILGIALAKLGDKRIVPK